MGLLVDGRVTAKWVHDLATWARSQDGLDVWLVKHGPTRKPDANKLNSLWRRLRERGIAHVLDLVAFKVLLAIETRMVRSSARYAQHVQLFDLGTLGATEIEITPEVSPSGVVYRFSETDLQKVRAAQFDVLVRCGSGILRGPILDAARLGIISFHHGDNRVNRGGPPGFWEVFYEWPKTGFVIQRLTEELDGGDVLVRGSFPTQRRFLSNQAHVFNKANEHMKDLLVQMAESGGLPIAEEPLPYAGPLYREPRLTVSLAYLASSLRRVARNRYDAKIRKRDMRWRISVTRTDWRHAVLWKAKTAQVPPGRFWADPFLIEEHGKTYCFVEDYVFATRKGHISAIELTAEGFVDLGPAVVEPFHLSFPYLFRYQGALYMCPEASGSGEIRVYRCRRFPLEWEHAATLMKGVSAADTMLFERSGSWWMLTNMDRSGMEDHNAELYLFSSDSPLSARWTAHPCNPLVINPDGGRNAGLIIERDAIYRLGQRQGFSNYGEGLRVFRIKELSKSSYSETAITDLAPGFSTDTLGIHHLSTTGKITVFDYKVNEKIGL